MKSFRERPLVAVSNIRSMLGKTIEADCAAFDLKLAAVKLG